MSKNLLVRVLAVLESLTMGEVCDHSVGICACEAFAVRDSLRTLVALGTSNKLCASCGAEFPADVDGDLCSLCYHNEHGDSGERDARVTVQRVLALAEGCHDYNGGHSDERDNQTYHHGIQTVINVLNAAFGPHGNTDTQVAAVERIGTASLLAALADEEMAKGTAAGDADTTDDESDPGEMDGDHGSGLESVYGPND